MHVHHSMYIRSRSMNRGMDVVTSRIHHVHVAPHHNSFIVDKDEIVGHEVIKRLCEWINPKMIVKLWIANGHMSSSALISVALRSEPSQSGGMMQLAELSLLGKGFETLYANQCCPAPHGRLLYLPRVSDLLDWLDLAVEVACSIWKEYEVARVQQVPIHRASVIAIRVFQAAGTDGGDGGSGGRRHVDGTDPVLSLPMKRSNSHE